MKSITMVAAFGLACLIASGLNAEIYYWTDENGVRHYSNSPTEDRTVQIKTAREIQSGPEASQDKELLDEQNFEAILEELDEADSSSAPSQGTTKQKLSRQEWIQMEQEKLEEKLAYLENLPADAFANSRSRNVIIGQILYRLDQLRSDPDGYFEKYGN